LDCHPDLSLPKATSFHISRIGHQGIVRAFSQKLRTSKIVLDNAGEVEVGLRVWDLRKFKRISKMR
jgi:hypothetical protein